MTTRDWKWIVGILSGIIVFLLSYKFWGKPGNLTEIISIGTGLASIALAITAIIIAVAEGVRISNKEQKVDATLDRIIRNLGIMKKLIGKLHDDNYKTHEKLDKVYINFYNEAKEQGSEEKEYNYKENTKEELIEEPKEEAKEEPKEEAKEKDSEEYEASDKAYKVKENSKGVRNFKINRGDVFYADLSPVIGYEQGGIRPVVIIQNRNANKFSPTATVAPITSNLSKVELPTHVEIKAKEHDIPKDSVILLEQIKTVDKIRLIEKISELDEFTMHKVDQAILIHMELIDINKLSI